MTPTTARASRFTAGVTPPGVVGCSTQQLVGLARQLTRRVTQEEYDAFLDWVEQNWDSATSRRVADLAVAWVVLEEETG
jgi:hypothetical protein